MSLEKSCTTENTEKIFLSEIPYLSNVFSPLCSVFSMSSVVQLSCSPYFARKMIRALDRSYGVRSTVTLSPGRILM